MLTRECLQLKYEQHCAHAKSTSSELHDNIEKAEPKRHKTYLRTCAPSIDSEPAQSHSLIKIYTGRILMVKDAMFPHVDNENSAGAQADLSLLKFMTFESNERTQRNKLVRRYVFSHYENMPIQIYRKFYHQKMKIFRKKNLIFFIFLLKT